MQAVPDIKQSTTIPTLLAKHDGTLQVLMHWNHVRIAIC